MNIAAFIISLLAGLISFIQGGCGTTLSGLGGRLADTIGDSRSSRDFATLGGAGLLVMLASLIGIIGGSMALGRKKSAYGWLTISAVLCFISSGMGFRDAVIYGILYFIAAICAYAGSSSEENTEKSTTTTTNLSQPSSIWDKLDKAKTETKLFTSS